jgi:hypothetical protein
MSQESLPPEADELAELRREALQLLRESLRAAPGPAGATLCSSRPCQAACSPWGRCFSLS